MPPEPAACASAYDQRTLRAVADELLEEHRVEFVEDGVLSVMPPAGFTHRRIVTAIFKAVQRAYDSGRTSMDWDLGSENFQFDLVDDPQRFFVPDLAIAYPGSTNNKEFRENLAMVVEVTSPPSPKTVANDREVKPRQYAKAGVPCYLLVDQAEGQWTLYCLEGDRPGYRVHSSGRYGGSESAPIKLPEPFGFALPTDEWPAYRED
jgi:Uma2 family endonuclease